MICEQNEPAKKIGLSYPIHNLIQKWQNTEYWGVLFRNLLSFAFGYETNIAGTCAPPNFHVAARKCKFETDQIFRSATKLR